MEIRRIMLQEQIAMRPLRILHVTYDWYPHDILVRRVCEAAMDGGVTVDVLCSRGPGEARVETCNGVRAYRLPITRKLAPPLPQQILLWTYFMMIAGVVASWLQLRRRYDVVHVHNMPDFLVFAALGPRLLGAKVILHVQDVCPELMTVKARGRKRQVLRAMAVLQERISTAFATHVITVGWPFERLLLQRGVPPRKLSIVLNSADPRLFSEERRTAPRTAPPSADNPLVLMYHGTLAARNGIDTTIRALALALPNAPHLRLDLMGAGEGIPALKQLAADLGVAERVVFIKSVPSERIVDFVTHGDVGVISYPVDGFMELVLPTKAYEYAWLAKPMIASDTPAIRSMFRPDSLVLCDPSDPAAFAAAMVDLYRNTEKRVQLAERALADYSPYRWELMAQRYVDLLAELTGGKVAASAVAEASSLPRR
jgi:glycosyltransferase involved in cell wall biosynthesis